MLHDHMPDNLLKCMKAVLKEPAPKKPPRQFIFSPNDDYLEYSDSNMNDYQTLSSLGPVSCNETAAIYSEIKKLPLVKQYQVRLPNSAKTPLITTEVNQQKRPQHQQPHSVSDIQSPVETLFSSAPLAKPESFSDLLCDDLDDLSPPPPVTRNTAGINSNSSLYLNLNPNLLIDGFNAIDDLNTSNMYYDDSISYKLDISNTIPSKHDLLHHNYHQSHHYSHSHIVSTKDDDDDNDNDDLKESNLAWWPYTDTSSFPATQNNSLTNTNTTATYQSKTKPSYLAAAAVSPPVHVKKCIRNKIKIVIEPSMQSPPNSTLPNRRISTSTPRTESTLPQQDWMHSLTTTNSSATPSSFNSKQKQLSSQYYQQDDYKRSNYDTNYEEYDYEVEESSSDIQINSSNNSFLLNSYSLNMSSLLITNEMTKPTTNGQLNYDRPKMSASFDCSSYRMPPNMLLLANNTTTTTNNNINNSTTSPNRLHSAKPKVSKSLADARQTATVNHQRVVTVSKNRRLKSNLSRQLAKSSHASSMSLSFGNQFRFMTDMYDYKHNYSNNHNYDNINSSSIAVAANKISSTWLKASSSMDNRIRGGGGCVAADHDDYDFNNESLIANYESIEKLALLKPQSKDYILCFDTSSIDNSNNNNNNNGVNGSATSVNILADGATAAAADPDASRVCDLDCSQHNKQQQQPSPDQNDPNDERKRFTEEELMTDSFNCSSHSSSYYIYNNSSSNGEQPDSLSTKGTDNNNKIMMMKLDGENNNKNDDESTFKSTLDSCDSGVDTARTLSPYVFSNFVLTKNQDNDESNE